jgi:hypothetical protein
MEFASLLREPAINFFDHEAFAEAIASQLSAPFNRAFPPEEHVAEITLQSCVRTQLKVLCE